MAGSLAYEAKTPEEASEYVKEIAKDKPDLIKLMITAAFLTLRLWANPAFCAWSLLLLKPPAIQPIPSA